MREGEAGRREGVVWCDREGGDSGEGEGREGEEVVFVCGRIVSVCGWSFLNVGGRPYMGGHGHWVPCHHCVMVVMVGIVVWCGRGAVVWRWWYWVIVVHSAGPSSA